MKNPREWDEDDLSELVRTGTQESIELDFKESADLQRTEKKKECISKDVSAFANSAGGTIVYGIIEDTYTHTAKAIDEGCNPQEITKEWLEQIINSTIHQRIDGVIVRQIPLIQTHPEKVAYIVYVPFSTRTAHQAINKRFYKRFNFQSVPMEEYEVRDLYRRRDTPDLRILFSLVNKKVAINEETEEVEPISLITTITNDAIEPAEYSVIKIYIDAGLSVMSTGDELSKREGLALSFAGKVHPITLLSMNWSIAGKLPIFNDAYFNITENPIKFKMEKKELSMNRTYLLGYEVKSPRMTTKQAFTLMKISGDTITLSDQYMNGEEVSANYNELRF